MLRVAALTCCLVLIAGCGSHTTTTSTKRVAIAAPPRVAAAPGLLGGDSSAGVSDGYRPTGTIVADSGFRPARDGFAFENYGNDAGPVNLTPADVEDVFGSGVCAAGTGSTCELIPSARQWMAQENQSMAGGHCMGFSVSALRFYEHSLAPADFGARATFGLPVRGNVALQRLIAEDFTYQALPSVVDRQVTGSPRRVLATLTDALKSRGEAYTLGIVKADGTGGHAITPFAVEDRGGGRSEILVYDNNFPGVVRAVDVDTRSDRWHYVGGTNPSDADEVYEGDASTKSMVLLPTSPGVGRQPCPFCPRDADAKGPSHADTIPDRFHFIEVALDGSSANHPHLLFTDAKGRRTGYVGTRLLQEIPGIDVVRDFSVRNWGDGPEPRYRLPLGHPAYQVTVDGSSVTRATRSRITVNGAGILFAIKSIRMSPGQKDTLLLPVNDRGVYYQSTARFPGTPVIAAQFAQFDGRSAGGRSKARLITVGTGSFGYAPGSPIALRLLPDTGTAVVEAAGSRALASAARFIVTLDSDPLDGHRSTYYPPVKLPLDPAAGEAIRFHYLHPKGRLRLDVLGPGRRVLRHVSGARG